MWSDIGRKSANEKWMEWEICDENYIRVESWNDQNELTKVVFGRLFIITSELQTKTGSTNFQKYHYHWYRQRKTDE